MFGEGISRSSEILDLGVEFDIIKKSGSWFSYDGSKLAQGREAAKAVIDDNPELADELEEKIFKALYDEEHGEGKKRKKANKNDKEADDDDDASDNSDSDTAEEKEKSGDDFDFDADLPDDFGIEIDE